MARILGFVRINGENGGMGAHLFSAPNHGEEGAAKHGSGVGDTIIWVSTVISEDEVDGHIH